MPALDITSCLYFRNGSAGPDRFAPEGELERPQIHPGQRVPLTVGAVAKTHAEGLRLVGGHAEGAVEPVPYRQLEAAVAAPMARFGAMVQLVVCRADEPAIERLP